MHTSHYRNPQELPAGAVLVVGSGQSGCQITEELYQAGRKVYLCTGGGARAPRRYRGKDFAWWAVKLGILDKTVNELDSPAERFKANPHVTGRYGGRSLNLHQFALDGVTLLGRLQDASGSKVFLASDLKENLMKADQAAAELLKGIDAFIEKSGMEAPEDEEPELRAGYEAEVITELDLGAAGITSVIWATGFTYDFNWIKFSILDEYGYPRQERGVTEYPGLYFVGLHWLHTLKSGLFAGVGDDAAHIAKHMASLS
jgi:putative flavoprotein involved in K+ transport